MPSDVGPYHVYYWHSLQKKHPPKNDKTPKPWGLEVLRIWWAILGSNQ